VKTDSRKILLISVLGLIAGATWWLMHRATRPEDSTSAAPRHNPDYIAEAFSTIKMSESGKPVYELRATRLTHYADDGASELDQPYLIQYQPGQAPTHIRGKHGYMPSTNDWIRFTGDVSVTHGRDARGAGADVRTQTLTVQLDK
jgi:lipopolysaccharide export system protein LptC